MGAVEDYRRAAPHPGIGWTAESPSAADLWEAAGRSAAGLMPFSRSIEDELGYLGYLGIDWEAHRARANRLRYLTIPQPVRPPGGWLCGWPHDPGRELD